MKSLLKLIVILLTALLVLGTIAEYTMGRWLVLKLANHHLKRGHLELADAKLGFLSSPQVLKDVTYIEESQNVRIHAKEVRIDESLLHLLLGANGFKVDVSGADAYMAHPDVEITMDNTHLGTWITREGWPTQLLLEGRTRHNGIEGNFLVTSELAGLPRPLESYSLEHVLNALQESPEALLTFEAHVNHFPTELLEELIAIQYPELDGTLLPFVGKTFNLESKQTWTSQQQGGSLNVTGTDFLLNIEAAYINQILSLTNPAQLSAVLPPSFVNGLKNVPLQLAKPAKAQLLVETFSLPLQPSQDLKNLSLTATVTLDHALIGAATPNAGPVEVRDVNLTLNTDPGKETIEFSFNAQAGTESKPNPMLFGGTIRKPATFKELYRDFFKNQQVNFKGTQLPTRLISVIPGISSSAVAQAEAVWGPWISAQGSADLKAAPHVVQLEATGANGFVKLQGIIAGQDLLLTAPLEAQVSITPELTKRLKKKVPLLAGLEKSDRPIQLKILPEGFKLPLQALSFEKVQVGKGFLDLGKLQFNNQGSIQQMLQMFLGGSPGDFELWVTPVYFSIHTGLIKLERVDVLVAKDYPIALWGTVDIPKDNLNVTLGLSGVAISRAFNVKGIAANEFAQVAIRGSLQNPQIDQTQATSQIMAKSVENQVGLPGLILGTLLNLSTGNFAQASVTPPPTTNPLPWGNIELKEEADAVASPILPAPVQIIEENAAKLIKNIFGKTSSKPKTK